MANLTSRLGFANEHMDFAFAFDQSEAEQLWNRLGLTGLIGVIPLTFGEPFLTYEAPMRTVLAAESPIIGVVGRRARTESSVEKRARFSSTRITRSTE